MLSRSSTSSFMDAAMPVPLEAAQAVWIDSVEGLIAMNKVLQQHHSFALDLEHHAEHSYLGFTCLLQINAGGCLALALLISFSGCDLIIGMKKPILLIQSPLPL